VLLLIREALANVVRHARASRARVEVRARDDALVLVVTDNGRGFPFRSRLSDADLVAHDVGPRSIRERVASLGGSLTVSSADDGSRLTSGYQCHGDPDTGQRVGGDHPPSCRVAAPSGKHAARYAGREP
jgi:signal transduction histidine kinase